MRILIAGLIAVLAGSPSEPLAAVLNDEVTSVKLKEADNTASQDTNTGAGVKTGHLQNKAVTGAKMADGTISATQLATGAVTDVKITGPISTSKLNVGTAAGTVAAGNHTHGVYQQKYAYVVVVAKSGGDFTSLASALAAITDASVDKPYLVKIMPGVYDLGAGQVSIQSWVEVEGSGEVATKLVGALICASNTVVRSLTLDSPAGQAISISAADVTLKDLTIRGYIYGIYINNGARIHFQSLNVSESSAGSDHAAILVANATDVRMHDVLATVGGPDYGGTAVAIHNWYSTNVSLENVTAIAAGGGSSVYGILNFLTQAVRITDSYVKASGAYSVVAIQGGGTNDSISGVTAMAEQGQNACYVLSNGGGPITIDGSRLLGPCPTSISGYGVSIGSSRVDGAVSASAVKCIGVYNANYDPVTCP